MYVDACPLHIPVAYLYIYIYILPSDRPRSFIYTCDIIHIYKYCVHVLYDNNNGNHVSATMMTTATMPTTRMRVNAQKSLFIGKKKKFKPTSVVECVEIVIITVRPSVHGVLTKPIDDHMYNIIILYLYICYYY